MSVDRNAQLRPAVFFDRDGPLVNNIQIPDLPGNHGPRYSSELIVNREAAAAVREAHRLGLPIFVISNQTHGAEGRLHLSYTDTLRIERETDAEFRKQAKALGITFDEIYYCYDSPGRSIFPERNDPCDCQKPKPGMLHRASQEFGIVLSESLVVGDRLSDVLVGRRVGAKTVLLDIGTVSPEQIAAHQPPPDYIVTSMLQVPRILRELYAK